MNSNELEKGAFAMDTPKVFESEYRFCLILWENEPVKSSKLVELCKEPLLIPLSSDCLNVEY